MSEVENGNGSQKEKEAPQWGYMVALIQKTKAIVAMASKASFVVRLIVVSLSLR